MGGAQEGRQGQARKPLSASLGVRFSNLWSASEEYSMFPFFTEMLVGALVKMQ